MRDFERRRGRLGALSFHARLVYSVFAMFTIAGVVLTSVLTHEMVGLGVDRVDDYYAGLPEPEPDAIEANVADEPGGPSLELAPEDDAGTDRAEPEPMATRKLLEVTHFHLFSVPVYLLVLSHLFMLSMASDRSKTIVIVLGSVAAGLHVVAPWWAAYRPGLASQWVFATSGALMLLGMLWMALVPLFEMWRAPRPE